MYFDLKKTTFRAILKPIIVNIINIVYPRNRFPYLYLVKTFRICSEVCINLKSKCQIPKININHANADCQKLNLVLFFVNLSKVSVILKIDIDILMFILIR